jgi:DNA-binding transcriptional ArsR family regulator
MSRALQSRPLYDTAADRALFVPPARAWQKIMVALEREFNVAVFGDRGSGKTSLIRQVALHRRETSGMATTVVDAAGAQTGLALIERIRAAVADRSAVGAAGPGESTSAALEILRGLGDLPAHLIVLDCSSSAGAAYELFGRLRDEVWQLPHQWLVAADESEMGTLLRPPADVFFDVTVRLDAWSPQQLGEMLTLRDAGLEPDDLASVVGAADGNPRRALQAARDALTGDGSAAERLHLRAQREAAAAQLGRTHAMVLAELEDLGGASAADEVLQQRLGVTRARISQVLRDLLRAGLVDAAHEPQARGRPRVVYRPATDRVWE